MVVEEQAMIHSNGAGVGNDAGGTRQKQGGVKAQAMPNMLHHGFAEAVAAKANKDKKKIQQACADVDDDASKPKNKSGGGTGGDTAAGSCCIIL